ALVDYAFIAVFAFGLAALVLFLSTPTKEEKEQSSNQDKQTLSSNKEGIIGIAALLLFFTVLTILARRAPHS
ncbi:MAG TPA: hypothetical protein VH593_17520, partial [Ktedonobacteraceae bacterium]